jgi:pimeloyl-ACP methyl ester carboxylesterase
MDWDASNASRRAAAPATDTWLRLADGRQLAFCEYGAPDGPPTFFFHGWPGSRLDFAPNGPAAAAAGVRVIAIDRPGIGRSDPHPRRKVLDWPRDVAELADSLGIDRFSVFGFSFGGPYARVCAYALPDRVVRAGLVSCLGAVDDPAGRRAMPPATRYGLGAARISPLLARPMVWMTARQARGGKMVAQLSKSMAPSDAEVLSRSEVAAGLGRSLAESFRQGVGAATWDGVAVARGEGFKLEDIRTNVLIWHGEQDRNDPVAMAQAQERRLRHVRARYYAGEGHLIFFSRISDILAGLAAP